jgi:hypothetical protein
MDPSDEVVDRAGEAARAVGEPGGGVRPVDLDLAAVDVPVPGTDVRRVGGEVEPFLALAQPGLGLRGSAISRCASR